jgi:hypothetical protein
MNWEDKELSKAHVGCSRDDIYDDSLEDQGSTERLQLFKLDVEEGAVTIGLVE